jgi:hypothetical protein
MLCHGELVRLKPAPERLTSFYLSIAAGGALGGVIVGIIAPLIFVGYGEWPLAMLGGAVLAIVVLIGVDSKERFARVSMTYLPATAILAGAGGFAALWANADDRAIVEQVRNFYGVSKVAHSSEQADGQLWLTRILVNGRVRHGVQFLDESRRGIPTAYYGEASGVGRTIRYFAAHGDARVGAIGLGVGTLAAYAQPGDDYTFYELNPIVERLCDRHFSFLADARRRIGADRIRVVDGDARLSLERDDALVNVSATSSGNRRFQVLAVDAFNSEAIPLHLLTKEAADIYRRHLADDGALAFHVSNMHLRLAPVVRGLADHLQLNAVEIDSPADPTQATIYAEWVIVTNNERLLAELAPYANHEPQAKPILWTDDYSNLVQILR